MGLYAESYLTREDYAKMFRIFNVPYENMRKRYNCEKAFPHVYEKISKLGRMTVNHSKFLENDEDVSDSRKTQ